MDTPLRITFQNTPSSDAIRQLIEEQVEHLEQFFGRMTACHIVFISRAEKERAAEILKQIEGKPVLTVGEEEGFCRMGGTTNILIEKERPRLEVNPDAAEQARLTINAKLLKVATIVRTVK